MGRIKTKLIKRLTKKLMVLHNDEFNEDFAKNKGLVQKYISESSIKIRNIIAGYVTKLKRNGWSKEYTPRPAPAPKREMRPARGDRY